MDDIMLSRDWSLAAAVASATAKRLGLPNNPPLELLGHLKRVAEALDAVQDLVPEGKIRLNSFYRSPKVNAAVGGSPTSYHMLGLAADIDPPDGVTHDDLQHRIANSPIVFDTCAEEGTLLAEDKGGSRWIHLQLPKDGAPARRLVVDWTVDRLGGHITRSAKG